MRRQTVRGSLSVAAIGVSSGLEPRRKRPWALASTFLAPFIVACPDPASTPIPSAEPILSCTLSQPLRIEVDGEPVESLTECWILADTQAADTPFSIFMGNEAGNVESYVAVIGLVPGGAQDPDGAVILDVAPSIYSDAQSGPIPPGSAWLSLLAPGGSFESTGEGQVAYRGTASLAAESGDKVVWLPDGSGLVFSVIEFEGVPVRTSGGLDAVASGEVSVVARPVTTSDPCAAPEAGGAECVEFNACIDQSDCTCPGTTCGVGNRCCVLPGDSCAEGGQCCSGYCSPAKQCEPEPPAEAMSGCNPEGAYCDYSEDCPAGQFCVDQVCTEPGGPLDPCAALGRWYARCPADPVVGGVCDGLQPYGIAFDIPGSVTEQGGAFSSAITALLDVGDCSVTTYARNVCTTDPITFLLQEGTGSSPAFCGGQCVLSGPGADCIVSRDPL